jgi:hypothetical protein
VPEGTSRDSSKHRRITLHMYSNNYTLFVVRNGPNVVIKQGQVLRMKATVARYGARHWAVYYNGELLAVTVYKKGALAVQNALESQSRSSAR